MGQIFEPLWSQILQNRPIYKFSSIFLTSFDWIHTKLDLKAHFGCFCRCVKDRTQTPKCLGHFGPPNESKFRFSTILLKSFL